LFERFHPITRTGLLITPGIPPVLPDKVRVQAVRTGAVVAATGRTRNRRPPGDCPDIIPFVTGSCTKISPDPVGILTGHDESVMVLISVNIIHLIAVLTGHLIGSPQQNRL
jgi:hypothetical protein